MEVGVEAKVEGKNEVGTQVVNEIPAELICGNGLLKVATWRNSDFYSAEHRCIYFETWYFVFTLYQQGIPYDEFQTIFM